MRGAIVSLLVVPLLIPSASLSAQEQPPIEPGQRVRVTAPAHAMNRQVATFEALADSMLVVLVNSRISIPLAEVDRLEASRRSGWRGAGIGFLIGAGVGFAIGQTHVCCVMDNPHSYGVAACSVLGGLLGGLAGLATSTERWEEVPLGQLRVSVAPQRDGRLGIGLALKF